jgi:MtN3 and saliva related transmembrane protein
MELAGIFGGIGGILTSIRLIPQVLKSYRTKETKDLSFMFVIILLFQALFLILYGLTKPDDLIVLMNMIPFFCSIVLIYLKRKYK